MVELTFSYVFNVLLNIRIQNLYSYVSIISYKISEKMAGNMREEVLEEEFKLKEENICIEEEEPSPPTAEDICTVYIKGEGKTENTEIQGNVEIPSS